MNINEKRNQFYYPPFSTFRKGGAKSFEVLHNFSEKLLGGAKTTFPLFTPFPPFLKVEPKLHSTF